MQHSEHIYSIFILPVQGGNVMPLLHLACLYNQYSRGMEGQSCLTFKSPFMLNVRYIYGHGQSLLSILCINFVCICAPSLKAGQYHHRSWGQCSVLQMSRDRRETTSMF